MEILTGIYVRTVDVLICDFSYQGWPCILAYNKQTISVSCNFFSCNDVKDIHLYRYIAVIQSNMVIYVKIAKMQVVLF